MSQLSSASRSSQAATLLLLLLAAAATAQAPATPGAACHNDLVALRSTCYEYVQEDGAGGSPPVPPSSACCATLIGVPNLPCVCDYLRTDLSVDLDKVYYVARRCGVAIPRRCGYSEQV